MSYVIASTTVLNFRPAVVPNDLTWVRYSGNIQDTTSTFVHKSPSIQTMLVVNLENLSNWIRNRTRLGKFVRKLVVCADHDTVVETKCEALFHKLMSLLTRLDGLQQVDYHINTYFSSIRSTVLLVGNFNRKKIRYNLRMVVARDPNDSDHHLAEVDYFGLREQMVGAHEFESIGIPLMVLVRVNTRGLKSHEDPLKTLRTFKCFNDWEGRPGQAVTPSINFIHQLVKVTDLELGSVPLLFYSNSIWITEWLTKLAITDLIEPDLEGAANAVDCPNLTHLIITTRYGRFFHSFKVSQLVCLELTFHKIHYIASFHELGISTPKLTTLICQNVSVTFVTDLLWANREVENLKLVNPLPIQHTLLQEVYNEVTTHPQVFASLLNIMIDTTSLFDETWGLLALCSQLQRHTTCKTLFITDMGMTYSNHKWISGYVPAGRVLPLFGMVEFITAHIQIHRS